jgi:hypothetical protein
MHFQGPLDPDRQNLIKTEHFDRGWKPLPRLLKSSVIIFRRIRKMCIFFFEVRDFFDEQGRTRKTPLTMHQKYLVFLSQISTFYRSRIDCKLLDLV